MRVFISYAWENDEYRVLVKRLAARLREDGINARLDAWHLEGLTIPEFMSREVRHADKVLVVCSPHYREKVRAMEDGERITGTGWESMLVTSSIWANLTDRKKITVVLLRGAWQEAAPDVLIGLPYFYLSNLTTFETNYRDLFRSLTGQNEQAPPLGQPHLVATEPVEPLRGLQNEAPAGVMNELSLKRLDGSPTILFPGENTSREIRVRVQQTNVVTAECDVLALKFARSFHGADRIVADRLLNGGVILDPLPTPGKSRLIDSSGQIAAKAVLFVGTGSLGELGYREIREFGYQVLTALAGPGHSPRHICLTVHGPNYGLDETEAFEAEIGGLAEAVRAGNYPEQLQEITIAELDNGRAERLAAVLDRLLPNRVIERNPTHQAGVHNAAIERLERVGYDSDKKRSIFVAVPEEFDDDIFHFGISGPVNAAGFLCERSALTMFQTDDIEREKRRISSCELVIADLSIVNAYVYFELGYAWGCEKSTILLAKDPADLQIQLPGQHCIVYKKIRDLEDILRRMLLDPPMRHAND